MATKKEEHAAALDDLDEALSAASGGNNAPSSAQDSDAPSAKPRRERRGGDVAAIGSMTKTPPKSIPELVLHLDPRRCRRWKYHDRFSEWFTPERCGDLIDSLLIEGQKEPVKVKEIHGDPDYDYEIIVGGRRHYSVTHIVESGIDKSFLLQAVKVKGDTEDLVEHALLTYLENDGREAITDFERGVFFRQLLGKSEGFEPLFHDDGEDVPESERKTAQQKVMEKFQFKKSLFSKLIAAAELNDYPDVMQAIKDRTKITYALGQKLSSIIKRSEKDKERILSAAREMFANHGKQSAGEVIRQLISVIEKKEDEPESITYDDDSGRDAVVYKPSLDGSAVIHLKKNAASMKPEQLQAHLAEIIETFMNGVT